MKFFLIAKNNFFLYITQVLLNFWWHKRISKTPKNKNDFINTEKLPHFVFFPSNKGADLTSDFLEGKHTWK